MTTDPVHNVFDRVTVLCDQWERSSPPLPPDARHLLAKLAREIVLDAARVCEGRALRAEELFVRNEATKCADAVRHALLCRESETICLYCSGAGCTQCEQGVRKVKERTP